MSRSQNLLTIQGIWDTQGALMYLLRRLVCLVWFRSYCSGFCASSCW